MTWQQWLIVWTTIWVISLAVGTYMAITRVRRRRKRRQIDLAPMRIHRP